MLKCKELVLNDTFCSRCLVKITPQDIYWDIRFYLIPFAIIVGICFILMAMFMVCQFCRVSRQEASIEEFK